MQNSCGRLYGYHITPYFACPPKLVIKLETAVQGSAAVLGKGYGIYRWLMCRHTANEYEQALQT